MRDLIEKTPLIIDGKTIPITISVGVAACEAADLTWEDALQRADSALYHAKNTGRNRLSVHGDHPPQAAGIAESAAMAG